MTRGRMKDDPKKKEKKYAKAHAEQDRIKQDAEHWKAEQAAAEEKKKEQRSPFRQTFDSVKKNIEKGVEKAKDFGEQVVEKVSEYSSAVMDKAEETKEDLTALRTEETQWKAKLQQIQNELTALIQEIENQKIPVTLENKEDKNVKHFNASLEKNIVVIQGRIHSEVRKMQTELEDVTLAKKIGFSDKLKEFEKNHTQFIEDRKAAVEVSKKTLSEDTLKELYTTLSNVIKDPMWKKHALVGVPTGVKEMRSVLSGTEKDKWYTRRRKGNEPTITLDEMLLRIQKMEIVAERRLQENDRRSDETRQLYTALKALSIPDTKSVGKMDAVDREKFNTCIKEVKEIKHNHLLKEEGLVNKSTHKLTG